MIVAIVEERENKGPKEEEEEEEDSSSSEEEGEEWRVMNQTMICGISYIVKWGNDLKEIYMKKFNCSWIGEKTTERLCFECRFQCPVIYK